MHVTTLYTVGHSDRALDELMSLLGEAEIRVLVDVRATPRSRRHPEFDAEALRAGAERHGIAYHWAGRRLGGRRRPRADSPHVALGDEGMRGYADHMETADFQAGAGQVLDLAAHAPLALMCAERDPERCHRSLIADYLTLQGHTVVHLVTARERREHALSPFARRESARLVYDRQVSGSLALE